MAKKSYEDRMRERDIQLSIDRLQIPFLQIPRLHRELTQAWNSGLRDKQLRDFAVAWLEKA